MKNKLLSIILCGTVSIALVACGNSASNQASVEGTSTEATIEASEEAAPSDTAEASAEEASTEAESEAATEASSETESTEIANPWRECTEEEAYQFGPNGFSAPEGATNVVWSIMEEKDNTKLPGTMIQMAFDLDGTSMVAREQPVAGEEIVDISGMNYEWTVTDEATLQNWGGGNMPCKTCRYIGDDEYVDVCLWFDIETGYAYSLSAVAKDLEGFDITAVAASIYDPAKQIGANMPEDEDAITTPAPSVDISGCDTFTQIIDQKLEDGMGYANVTVLGTDILLVSSGTFDNLDGKNAAIDSEAFAYIDGAVTEIGSMSSSGTAYPITIKDGYFYCGGNHYVSKYGIKDNMLVYVEGAHVTYDESGNETYYYESVEGNNSTDSAENEKLYNQLLDEMTSGEVVDFQPVKK